MHELLPRCARAALAGLLALVTAGHLKGAEGGSVSGCVTDPEGKVVAGAAVTLYARDAADRTATTADAGGAYRFEGLAAGEYLVEAVAPGLAAEATPVRVERGGAAQVDVALRIQGGRELVVVTASGAPQAPDEVSKAVTLITAGELEERNEIGVAEALRRVPGMRIQQQGGPGAFANIKIRGLRNEDTAVLIDGVRFREVGAPQGDASGYLADLIVTDVDRLEVLRGSGSSLYGSNAIGGVLNIVSDPGGGPPRGSVLMEGGSLGLFRGRARLSGGTARDQLTYSAGLAHLNVTSGVDGNDPARNVSGQGRVAYRRRDLRDAQHQPAGGRRASGFGDRSGRGPRPRTAPPLRGRRADRPGRGRLGDLHPLGRQPRLAPRRPLRLRRPEARVAPLRGARRLRDLPRAGHRP
jgi:iron complex outermembrane receptor protein